MAAPLCSGSKETARNGSPAGVLLGGFDVGAHPNTAWDYLLFSCTSSHAPYEPSVLAPMLSSLYLDLGLGLWPDLQSCLSDPRSE